ncbi:MAG: ABC transporter substrate-binding protein [Anaerolineae bacterium]|nr:ABC transporter substrate-binding protein [Anaerolineae bacterium]
MGTFFDLIPQRVVSLVPGMTETLFDLGLGGRVVAITNACTRPAEALQHVPRIGSPAAPDLAAILALAPDFALMSDELNRPEDRQALETAGVVVWETGPRSVQEALNLLWDTMDVFEEAEYSARVREIERAYDYTEGAMRAQRLVRVFVPFWQAPWITVNAQAFANDLLSICGGENCFADRVGPPTLGEAPEASLAAELRFSLAGVRYAAVSLAEVEAARPEVVLLPDAPYPFTAVDAQTFYALDIPAAQNGHIYTLDGSLLTWYGTRLAYAMQALPPIFDAVRKATATPDA